MNEKKTDAAAPSAPAVDALTTGAVVVVDEHRHLGHELQALIHWAHDQGGYWVLDKCQPELDALVRAARKEGMPPLDALKFNNMPHSASGQKLTDEQRKALEVAADALIERYAAPIRALLSASTATKL